MSSSSRPVRSYRRRRTNLDIDLNHFPPSENVREGEGPSAEPQEQLVPVIDVEAVDDDITESSPEAFAQAKTNARRNRRRTIVEADLGDRSREANNDPMQQIIDCNQYTNLEGSSSSENENDIKSPDPPKVPVFKCPICMAPLTEEVSTRCGHIFCKECIETAITLQGRCPICRKVVGLREIIRVFLPAAS